MRCVRDPKVYERLEHPPGAEAQVDFAKLGRVRYGARMVTTWLFVMTWPHSHWVYEDVVIDQTVPTFLGCIQDAIWASGSAPQRHQKSQCKFSSFLGYVSCSESNAKFASAPI